METVSLGASQMGLLVKRVPCPFENRPTLHLDANYHDTQTSHCMKLGYKVDLHTNQLINKRLTKIFIWSTKTRIKPNTIVIGQRDLASISQAVRMFNGSSVHNLLKIDTLWNIHSFILYINIFRDFSQCHQYWNITSPNKSIFYDMFINCQQAGQSKLILYSLLF